MTSLYVDVISNDFDVTTLSIEMVSSPNLANLLAGERPGTENVNFSTIITY